MARKRDIIIGVVIGGSFLIAFGFMALLMIGMVASSDTDSSSDWSGFGSSSIGVIEMYGVMSESSCRPLIEYLGKWKERGSIKAVVVHINSPGGGSSISQEMYEAIRQVAEEKPVVASMSEVAASGGFYIACGADRIVANPSTLTGSIGTIMSFNTFEGAMDKLGIDQETVSSGEMKSVGDPSRQMTKQEELMLRSVIMDSYEQFVAAIAEGRGMTAEEVYPIADGSLFTGAQAYNLGLVDTLGGLNDALDLAAELAEIGDYDVVRPRRREEYTIFDILTGLLGDIGVKVRESTSNPKLEYIFR